MNTVIDTTLDVRVTSQHGRYCIEINMKSFQTENNVSWVVISRGLDRIRDTAFEKKHANSTSTSTSSPTVPENKIYRKHFQ